MSDDTSAGDKGVQLCVVWTNGWSGRVGHSGIVMGETPKRYRVYFEGGPWKGQTRLVPRHAVQLGCLLLPGEKIDWSKP